MPRSTFLLWPRFLSFPGWSIPIKNLFTSLPFLSIFCRSGILWYLLFGLNKSRIEKTWPSFISLQYWGWFWLWLTRANFHRSYSAFKNLCRTTIWSFLRFLEWIFRLSLRFILKNRFFGRKFHSKTLKNDEIATPEANFWAHCTLDHWFSIQFSSFCQEFSLRNFY